MYILGADNIRPSIPNRYSNGTFNNRIFCFSVIMNWEVGITVERVNEFLKKWPLLKWNFFLNLKMLDQTN